jgi:hypothetical protein
MQKQQQNSRARKEEGEVRSKAKSRLEVRALLDTRSPVADCFPFSRASTAKALRLGHSGDGVDCFDGW